ncbi:proline-rich receptor-like protein kinase PERK15 isoform X2 [Punica granatum]|uniref:Proline-rich receptor-like protein kinase PERK15 isoform X2 n=1 Tax=Punica granatum TaxID=22663 RepID=A0A6P8BRU2_PUNGR|nr:proline-rich receptor-like protein kinase PERK15 isoform X2 [Punica granatum]
MLFWGISVDLLCSLLNLLAVFCIVSLSDASVTSQAIPDIPLRANVPTHRTWTKHVSPLRAPGPGFVISPAHPPHYGPLITSVHPPASSHLSRPSMKSSSLVPPPVGMQDIAPSQYVPGAVPGDLAEPPLTPYASHCCKPDMVLKRGVQGCHCVYPIKLDLLLLNISQNPDWNIFLEDFASQLGLRVSQIELINFYVITLSSLNISMDITPHTGMGFSESDASAINSSLSLHKVHLRPSLVGEYELLNFTWFKPPPLSQAPLVATSPIAARPHQSTAKPSATSDGESHSNLVFIIGIAAGIAIVLSIAMIIICACKFRRGNTKASEEVGDKDIVKPRTVDAVPRAGSLAHPHPSSTRILAYEELKEATNNFSSSSILGEGGFGRVFKGVLSDGTAVAIKRLTSGGQQGDKEFLVEVEMLSRLHHRNLVKLVGYYSSLDSSQNLLCYELVPNGSLESWLHGHLGVNCPLDWDTRMKIALDAARGLAYLHEDSQPCVIHRDFKASNILLENNFHAKVADFGLAKQAPEGRANYLSTRVMGTFGYVAPEYAMTGHLLVKSDVYSYGVVLLELLTGRKPVDMSQPSGQENLVTWARPILRDKDRLDELADPRLGGKYPKEDFVRVCTIAAACVAPEASQRPTMGEVVQSLKMVQRVTEYQDTTLPSATNTRPNMRQSSTTFESDGTSSIFSSGPYSGFSAFDNDNLSRTVVFSEDLHEGR